MSNYLDDDYPLDYGDSDSRAGSEGNEYIASIERLSTRPNDGVLEVGPYPTQSPSETFLSTSHEPRHTPHSPPTLHPTQIVNGLDDRLTALSQVLRGRILVQQPPPPSPTTTATTSHPPASRSVTDTISCTPEHSSAHSPFNSPPSYSIHTRSKSTRTSTSSKPSCDSPKSSSVTNHNTDKLLRSPNRRITKSGSASFTLSSSISYPPSTTLERSPIGKETASARITRVERNTIRVDQRIDLLLSGLETGLEERIAREVDCRVSVAMEMACEQMKKDFLANIAQSTADIHAHQPSPPSSSSLSSTHALLSPATLSLPKRPSYEVTFHATRQMVAGTTRTRSQPLLGEPHSVIVTLSPECPAFSTTIDFLFDMTRDWSTEVERHTNSYARLPIPSRILRIDSHHLQLTFNAFGIEAFLSSWNSFHDDIDGLSHLSVSRAA